MQQKEAREAGRKNELALRSFMRFHSLRRAKEAARCIHSLLPVPLHYLTDRQLWGEMITVIGSVGREDATFCIISAHRGGGSEILISEGRGSLNRIPLSIVCVINWGEMMHALVLCQFRFLKNRNSNSLAYFDTFGRNRFL